MATGKFDFELPCKVLVVEEYNIALNNATDWNELTSVISGGVVSATNILAVTATIVGAGFNMISLSGSKNTIAIKFLEPLTGTFKANFIFFYK